MALANMHMAFFPIWLGHYHILMVKTKQYLKGGPIDVFQSLPYSFSLHEGTSVIPFPGTSLLYTILGW